MIIPQILYDDRFVEKYDYVIYELERQGIKEYKLWNPILEARSVPESINISQKKIIQWAKDNGVKECCIFEDDIMFPNKKGWQYFLNNKPESYSIYLGGSYLVDNRIEYKAPLVKVNGYVGHHCIIVHESYYDRFLSVPNESHIDTVQEGMGDFYLCFPMPALQRPSRSANNNNQLVNYNAILPKGYIYE